MSQDFTSPEDWDKALQELDKKKPSEMWVEVQHD